MLYTIELYAINYITFFTEKKTYQMSYTQGESESEVAQSCPTLCDPMDSSLPGSRSMGFSRQEYWSGLPFPSPGDLPNPGIEPGSPALQTDALPSEAREASIGRVKNIFPLFLVVITTL